MKVELTNEDCYTLWLMSCVMLGKPDLIRKVGREACVEDLFGKLSKAALKLQDR